MADIGDFVRHDQVMLCHVNEIRWVSDECKSRVNIRCKSTRKGPPEPAASEVGSWLRKLQENLGTLLPARSAPEPGLPSLFEVVATNINIMQVRIARSRMGGEPADLAVAPRLAHLGLLDFQCAEEAIEEGRRAVRRVTHNLPELTSPDPGSEPVT